MHSENYSKYEQGNKISFKDFAMFLNKERHVNFEEVIVPKMKEAVKYTMEAFWLRL